MGEMIDWLGLWRELVERRDWRFQPGGAASRTDHWSDKAKEFDSHVRRRRGQPDSSRAFMISLLDAMPGSTVLDIGAGTGKWAIQLARHAKRVTALEPSPTMLELLRKNIAAEGLTNIEVVQGEWPQVPVAVHDVSLCSHAMYGSPDLKGFIDAMQAATRHTCVLLLRAPRLDGVMGQASQHIWGHPYDSPDWQVAFNALVQMGIFANVLMEEPAHWEPWIHASLDDALADTKRRLGLDREARHDEYLRDLLRRRLSFEDGQYVWPQDMRTALVFWRVDSEVEPQFNYVASPRSNDTPARGTTA